MKKLDTSSLEKFQEDDRAVSRGLLQRSDRAFRSAAAAAQSATPQGLRRAEVDRLRSGAGRLSRRVRLRHVARAQGHQAGRAAAGGGLPARAGGAAAGHRSQADKPAYYTSSPSKLAERGFITFAPQNLYIFDDRFRTLQRKANPLRQDAVLDHRAAAPADRRLAGDAAVRGPRADRFLRPLLRRQDGHARCRPLVERYCLSICSADFNEWVWKNASTGSRYSYMGTGEYEIFEFDLGSTFNYAEMAALIAPRPFMVERAPRRRGPDETVAYEYRQGAAPLRGQTGNRRPDGDRVLRRPAHDPRQRNVRVPA